jgi:hypothetical protein
MSILKPFVASKDASITENRLCHIRRPGTWIAWCGTAEFNPDQLHTVRECIEHHVQCVVCMHMREKASWET